MNMYAVFTLVLCGVYGVFMVIQGLANYRKTSGSTETFYNADRGVNTFMLVCSTAVSVFSGLAFYGWPLRPISWAPATSPVWAPSALAWSSR